MFNQLKYKSLLAFLKCFFPTLRKKLDRMQIEGHIYIKENKIADKTPRPSIIVMKEYFNNRKVKGCEIGVYKGKNAKSILKELNIDELFLIDPYDIYDENNHQIKISSNLWEKVKKDFSKYKNIIWFVDFSYSAYIHFKDNSLDFVYIDGNHEYQMVYLDISLYFDKVKEGGIIAGHDAFSKPVKKAVLDFAELNHQKVYFKYPDWIIKKEVVKNSAVSDL